MRTWRLVSGIITMVIFAIVMLQSCAVGIINFAESNGESSGSAGLFVGFMMLAAGIVSVATRNYLGGGGCIAIIILFGLAALVGYTNNANYEDLPIWSTWCLINAIIAVVEIVKTKKENKEAVEPEDGDNSDLV